MPAIRSLPTLADAINAHGFAFYPADRGVAVDDGRSLILRREGSVVVLARLIVDARGFTEGLDELGEYALTDVSAIVAALS